MGAERAGDENLPQRPSKSPYDRIAGLYDPWSRSVVEDVDFYVDLAVESGGPVVELGVGTGRIAIPTARAGIRVIGIDSSEGMLDVCRRRAAEDRVLTLLDLRLGDITAPPVHERVPLVTCPFRAYLHLDTETNRLRALGAARDLLAPDGRFVFDVFHPAPDDVAATHGRWIEREPEIFERAEWNEADRTLTLAVRGPDGTGTLRLAWISAEEWHVLLVRAGFEIEALYGWFDRRPYAGGEDSIWVARRLD
jgi:SAM-dependent methyltransferase